MILIKSKEELKEFEGKKHLHFCKRCWARFVCGTTRDRKDCKIPDGIICLECDSKARKSLN